jgi:thiamine-phosphate pyrophosphorylase
MLLYYITDRRAFPGNEVSQQRCLLKKIFEAAAAGVDYIQLREKDLPDRELETLAREAVDAVRNATQKENSLQPKTKLLVNSRSDVALAVGADGVHLRSEDLCARSLLWIRPHRSWLVAVSCHSEAELSEAYRGGADFAVLAPIFEKSGSVPIGREALKACAPDRFPVLALGGVSLENARICLAAGAAGIAGIRLFQNNNISTVVDQLRAL